MGNIALYNYSNYSIHGVKKSTHNQGAASPFRAERFPFLQGSDSGGKHVMHYLEDHPTFCGLSRL